MDTTTPSGEMMANVMAAFAQYGRRLISQRTRDALASLKLKGSGSAVRSYSPMTFATASRRSGRTATRSKPSRTAERGRQWWPVHRPGRVEFGGTRPRDGDGSRPTRTNGIVHIK